ncbi:5'/3'-nucleotidase SurE [Maritimibacter dapengensis]|uniref:5'-nucleotidase SurE n=1 Tax=Maritimibacter dapengensis TaxID=2836868 RepID=A0ABS6T3W0_9RHOB|nr:5'/3'-nucleotidase SurE [Maritimibacter dapengensis]MBV7379231.1 5'/3'-nucleotidase SurE [Maritimibacter dapengensis]
MRILITNDDGINAPGLKVLEAIATEIAGPDGEVWTVAPAFEQSGVAHCISYSRPMMMAELGPRRYAAEGSPADCVLAGLGEVLDVHPDLILSGVNRGNNAADNTMYSGTVGAAMEGALQGLPAIALSQFLGPKNLDPDVMFDAAAAWGVRVVKSLIERAPWQETADYRLFYNVNFPPVPAAEVKGIRATSQGWRPKTFFGTEPTTSPSGRRFVWIKGGPQHEPTAPGTDAAANLDGYVSVTPMRCDLTAHDALKDLETALA